MNFDETLNFARKQSAELQETKRMISVKSKEPNQFIYELNVLKNREQRLKQSLRLTLHKLVDIISAKLEMF